MTKKKASMQQLQTQQPPVCGQLSLPYIKYSLEFPLKLFLQVSINSKIKFTTSQANEPLNGSLAKEYPKERNSWHPLL